MSRGINKVILIGNLGQDPEFGMTPQGTPACKLSVATDESYKDKNSGQMVPKTEWHRVVMYNRLAEIARDYARKGSKVYIEGRLQTRKWQDQSGQDRYTTEIVARELQLLDSNPNAQQGGQQGAYQQQQAPQQGSQQGGYQQQRPQQQQQGGYQQQQQAPQQGGMGGAPDDFDDDIPF